MNEGACPVSSAVRVPARISDSHCAELITADRLDRPL